MASPAEFAAECRTAARNMRRLPSDIRRELGQRSKGEVAAPLAQKVAAAARGPWGRVLSGAVKTRASADPVIVVGGARRVVSGGASPRQLVYGTEFGGGSRVKAIPATARRRGHRRRTTRQFIGKHAPFVFPTIGDNAEWVLEKFADIVDDVLGRVTNGR